MVDDETKEKIQERRVVYKRIVRGEKNSWEELIGYAERLKIS